MACGRRAERLIDLILAETAVSARTPAGSVLIDVLEFNHDRKPKRVALKVERMAADPFAFFRGSCHRFVAAWGELRPPDPGPEILLCGDLHLENFGAYRDDAGEFLYDINDFDEATVAPCSIDLVRCAASILLAAEIWNLSPLEANGMVLTYLDEYRKSVTMPEHSPAIGATAPLLWRGPIRDLLGKTAMATQAELLDHQTELKRNGTRQIIRSKLKHPALGRSRADFIKEAVAEYGRAKGTEQYYEPLDVTGRIAGIGSLGLDRYLVLVAGGGSPETHRLLDVKECTPSAWLEILGDSPVAAFASSRAARVVHSQRILQSRPASGLDLIGVGGVDYRLREMIPEENRSSLAAIHRKPGKLKAAIETAGSLTGFAHLRGATASASRDVTTALATWASGPALDSVLAASARVAERSRRDHKQFRAEHDAAEELPAPLRERLGR
jgi:uncharacterized protein (DUF2252 family)